MIQVNEKNFNTVVLASNKPVVVDFWAPWCAPCKMVKPVLDEISKEYPNVIFAECNVDDNPSISREYQIRNIPAIFFFNKSKMMDKQFGTVPKSVFRDKINNLIRI